MSNEKTHGVLARNECLLGPGTPVKRIGTGSPYTLFLKDRASELVYRGGKTKDSYIFLKKQPHENKKKENKEWPRINVRLFAARFQNRGILIDEAQ